MAGSSQPQHFFSAGCLFADFAIAVIFYPVIKTLWKFLCPLFVFCHTQILNLTAKINFAKMLKIVRKLGQTLNLLHFWIIFKIFSKFLLSNLISECGKTQMICTKIFIKFLLQDKNDILEFHANFCRSLGNPLIYHISYLIE